MKTVVLLEADELITLQALLHDAKINLDKWCDVSSCLGEAKRKIEEAIEILTAEKGGLK